LDASWDNNGRPRVAAQPAAFVADETAFPVTVLKLKNRPYFRQA